MRACISVRRLGPEPISMRQWRVQPDVGLEFFLCNLSTSYIAYLLSSEGLVVGALFSI